MRLSAITLIPRSQKQAFSRIIAPRYATQTANSHTAAEQCALRRPTAAEQCALHQPTAAEQCTFHRPTAAEQCALRRPTAAEQCPGMRRPPILLSKAGLSDNWRVTRMRRDPLFSGRWHHRRLDRGNKIVRDVRS